VPTFSYTRLIATVFSGPTLEVVALYWKYFKTDEDLKKRDITNNVTVDYS